MNITNHPSLYRDVGISDGISVFWLDALSRLYISNKKLFKRQSKSAWWVKSRGNPLWTEAKLDSTNCLRQGREVWKSLQWLANWSKHLSLWWQLEITHGLPMYVNLTEKSGLKGEASWTQTMFVAAKSHVVPHCSRANPPFRPPLGGARRLSRDAALTLKLLTEPFLEQSRTPRKSLRTPKASRDFF